MDLKRVPVPVPIATVIMALIMIAVLQLTASRASAQDDATTVQNPTIQVDNPDSDVPDWAQPLTAIQFWNFAAAGLAVGGTALALRWIPMPPDEQKRRDVRQVVAFVIGGAVGIFGSYLNGQLNNFQPTIANVVYVVGIAWMGYEKIPGVKPLAATIEGKSVTTLTNT